ncbi:MAG TPA: hypothetical protein VFD36_30440, partial [Kofleriaceae bacterium]|nr:hypothetical protein [Kofleriaceae bacterium]
PLSIDIPAAVLPAHGTLLIGDFHGTREIPAVVGQLVTAAVAREPVVLALEIPTANAAAVQAFLASDGSAAKRSELVSGPWWQAPYQDGRRSVAMADLLEAVRALRAAGKPLEVVLIDEELEAAAREKAMAQHVIAARRARADAALIVYAGDLHTRKAEVAGRRGYRWMAMQVADAGIAMISLAARRDEGTAWICLGGGPAGCGVIYSGGNGPPGTGIHLAPSPDGAYDGWFGVGSTTASPPAGIPALAADLARKIAAAPTTPQGLKTRARRAYSEKRYDRCAELLGQIADPDSGTAYDQACCLARAGHKDEAFARLQFALDAGFGDLKHLEADDDLAPLRGDPRWPVKK